jgi:hypothetical protein
MKIKENFISTNAFFKRMEIYLKHKHYENRAKYNDQICFIFDGSLFA